MDRRIASALWQMHTGLHRPLRVGELARRVRLSPSRLIHLFTAETGVPPARYLRELRLARARAELEASSRLRVREVMALVGFSDASHFSRLFKQHFGVSPRALRRRLTAGARGTEARPSGR